VALHSKDDYADEADCIAQLIEDGEDPAEAAQVCAALFAENE
jgi:hypothetical protein